MSAGTVIRSFPIEFAASISERPVEGDIWRSHPGGSCYLIEDCRPSSSNPHKVIYTVVRLGKDAAALGDEGVWRFEWKRRGR